MDPVLRRLRTQPSRVPLPSTVYDTTIPAFADSFDPWDPALNIRGRGGDLDPRVYSVYRFNPDGSTSGAGNGVIGTRPTTIPTCRAGVASGTVYPPDDMLLCDSSSSGFYGTLMQSIIVQNYGVMMTRIRQPFDFAGRTGVISFKVDAVTVDPLATYICVALTDGPVSAPGFHRSGNNETGPLARNSVQIIFAASVGAGTNVGISAVRVCTGFTEVELTPTVQLVDSTAPTTSPGHLNYFEVRISSSRVQVYGSDFSVDNVTFTNFRLFYDAPLTAPFTRGYVHFGARNHAATKEGLGGGGAVPAYHNYHWNDVRFDGPIIARPRAYDVPDNTFPYAMGPDEAGQSYTNHSLGWQVSDGTGRTEGLWSSGGGSNSFVGPQSFAQPVDLTGMVSGILSVVVYVGNGTPDTTFGLKYRFNSGTWRTRLLATDEVTVLVNDLGCSNYLCLAIPILLSDLVQGTNTIDFSSVNMSMAFPPQVSSIDLELS